MLFIVAHANAEHLHPDYATRHTLDDKRVAIWWGQFPRDELNTYCRSYSQVRYIFCPFKVVDLKPGEVAYILRYPNKDYYDIWTVSEEGYETRSPKPLKVKYKARRGTKHD